MENQEQFKRDFDEILEKHLPAHLSKTLQTKLDELDHVISLNKELTSKNEILQGDLKDVNELLNNANEKIKILQYKVDDYDLKKSDIEIRERQVILDEIRVLNEITKKDMAVKHSEDLKNIITTVFSNKSVFESVTETHGGTWNWNSQTGRNEFVPDGNVTKNIIKS